MSEQLPPTNYEHTPSPELLGQVDLSQVQPLLEASYPTNSPKDTSMIEVNFGVAPSPQGDLYVSRYTISDEQYTGNDYLYDRHNTVGIPRQLIDYTSKLSESDKRYAHVFGFYRVDGENLSGQPETYVTAPTTEYLNTALEQIYQPTGVKPPMEFVTKEGSEDITGQEYIASLAEGRVLMASHENGYFMHDRDQHPRGVACLDPETAEIIKRKSQELIDTGKTTVDEQGKLTDPEAREFVFAVDHLTALVTMDATNKGNIGMDLKTLIDPKKNGLFAGFEVGKMIKRIKQHSDWVDSRVVEMTANEDMVPLVA